MKMNRKTNSALAAAILGFAALHAACAAPDESGIRVLGRAEFTEPVTFKGTRIGGLSGIVYHAKARMFYAVSDAKGGTPEEGPRVYRLSIPVGPKGFGAIEPKTVIPLRDAAGDTPAAMDAEGIAIDDLGNLLISHEGPLAGGTRPGISAFDRKGGRLLYSLPVPEYFIYGGKGATSGIENNRGFEGLNRAPGKAAASLFVSCESPLLQDRSGVSPIRLLRYDLAHRTAAPAERAYVPERDAPFTSVPDLLALDGHRLLVLERAVLPGLIPLRCRIRLFLVDFDEPAATDISGVPSLRDKPPVPLAKKLVFDSVKAGLKNLDNMEGITLGPTVGGARTLVLVADDNFRKDQRTEFLLLSLP